jgi:flavodoxin
MKALIIYDSTYGNTEKIAQAIGQAISGAVIWVGELERASLWAINLQSNMSECLSL